MNSGRARLGLILSVPLLLAGCAGPVQGASGPVAVATATPTGSNHGATDEGPPVKAAMVCGKEIMDGVATLAGEATLPAAKTTWADHLYTCTYQLPQGPLIISVKESSDPSTAITYFETLQKDAGAVTPLAVLEALGLPSFHTGTGQAAFVKDNLTLKVDASRLPARVGRPPIGRTSFADTVTSDILDCWRE